MYKYEFKENFVETCIIVLKYEFLGLKCAGYKSLKLNFKKNCI